MSIVRLHDHAPLSYEHYRELAEEPPHFADIPCRTTGAHDVYVEFPRLDDPARPTVFD